MKTLREEPTCSRSHKLEGTDSQSRCLDPSLSVLLLWLQTVGLQMAAQKPLGFQTRALVPLSSVIRSSRGSGCLPRSVLLGQSLPSLSCSFHSVLIRGPVTECWGERVLLGGTWMCSQPRGGRSHWQQLTFAHCGRRGLH